jgi:hypothetical protein
MALEAVLQAVRATNAVEFRYRPVTLEDAFIHHIGRLDEQFER